MTIANEPYRSPDRDRLLAAVESVSGEIEQGTAAAEERRDLSTSTVAAMREAGLLKYAAPQWVGGFEVDPLTNVEIAEALARVDLSAAWLAVQQSTSGPLTSRVVSDQAFEIVFDGKQPPILCGSIAPLPGAYRPVEGGYLVSGRWPFLSGVSHADWVNVSGTSTEDPQRTISALIPKSAVTKIDNWHVAGMKASGSYDVSLNEQFVPEHMTFEYRLPPVRVRDHEGRRGLFPHAMASAMALGGAQRVLDEVIKQALAKRRPGAADTVSGRAYFQHFVGESEMRLGAARAAFHNLVERMWCLEREEEGYPIEVMTRLTATPAFIYGLACDIATQALRFIGSNAARLENPLQRFHRDLTVLSLHVQHGEQYFESLGQALLGIDIVIPGSTNMLGGSRKTAADGPANPKSAAA